MSKKYMLFLGNLCLSFVACTADAEEAMVTVTDAYVRGLPPGVANTAAYMTIHNEGRNDLVLTGGSTDIAESVSIHVTVKENGMMSMQHRMSLDIPAGEEVVLESGGMHLMLMGLKGPMPRDAVVLTLEFMDGSIKELVLPVVSVLDE